MNNKAIFKPAYLAIALVLAFTVTAVSVPSVRASFTGWLGLGRAESNKVAIEGYDPADYYTPENMTDFDSVSEEAGWDILVPEWLPEDYYFSGVSYNSASELAMFSFMATKPLPGETDLTSTWVITLAEARSNDFVPMMVAPDTEVEDVTIGSVSGAYAIGAWDTMYDAETDSMMANWRDDLNIQNAFWQIDGTYFALITNDEELTQNDLITMASSIR